MVELDTETGLLPSSNSTGCRTCEQLRARLAEVEAEDKCDDSFLKSVHYLSASLSAVKQERDAARAEVERLRAENKALRERQDAIDPCKALRGKEG